MHYSRTEKCLLQFIVSYFGEADVPSCGKCSNCLDQSEKVDMTEDARKALSCVGRLKGRFGISLAAKVLKGSREKRILEFGLDRLSTYGLLRDWAEKDIADWLYWLVAEGYMRISEGEYPTVSLAAEALPVLEGKVTVLRRRSTAAKRRTGATSGGTANMPLFEALRDWRRETAAREHVPPFMLFFDSALREIADRQPVTTEQLLAVKGVGAAKAGKYGSDVIAIVRRFRASDVPAGTQEEIELSVFDGPELRGTRNTKAVRTADNNGASPGQTAGLSSHMQSLALMRQGYSITQIAAQREMSRVTIENHLLRCAEEGEPVDWDAFIPQQHEALILETIMQIGMERLRPIKEALPDEIDYFAIKAVMVKHSLAHSTE
jgi:ATP-dependent DNA helicase RecQ